MVALFLSGFDLLFLFVLPLGSRFTGIWSFYLKPKSLYLTALVTHNCNEKCPYCNEKVQSLSISPNATNNESLYLPQSEQNCMYI